jgi:predicted CopG family antitoxin
MGRHRYLKNMTTIAVDRDVAQTLKRLRRRPGEPIGEVVRRLVETYRRLVKIEGY